MQIREIVKTDEFEKQKVYSVEFERVSGRKSLKRKEETRSWRTLKLL